MTQHQSTNGQLKPGWTADVEYDYTRERSTEFEIAVIDQVERRLRRRFGDRLFCYGSRCRMNMMRFGEFNYGPFIFKPGVSMDDTIQQAVCYFTRCVWLDRLKLFGVFVAATSVVAFVFWLLVAIAVVMGEG